MVRNRAADWPDFPTPRKVKLHYFGVRPGIAGLWLIVATPHQENCHVLNPRSSHQREVIVESFRSKLEAEAWRDMTFQGRIVTHERYRGYAAGGPYKWDELEFEPATFDLYVKEDRKKPPKLPKPKLPRFEPVSLVGSLSTSGIVGVNC